MENDYYQQESFLCKDGPEKVGKTWAKYHSHPKSFCNVQDDAFTTIHRDAVLSWKDLDPDTLV